MQIKPIHNEEDYQQTLRRIEILMNACPDTEEADELEILATLAHAYKEMHDPIEIPDPIEAIRFRMEQMNLKTKDLASITHIRSNRMYEILNRSRPLTLSMIRRLSENLQISSSILIKDYPLQYTKKHKREIATF